MRVNAYKINIRPNPASCEHSSSIWQIPFRFFLLNVIYRSPDDDEEEEEEEEDDDDDDDDDDDGHENDYCDDYDAYDNDIEDLSDER